MKFQFAAALLVSMFSINVLAQSETISMSDSSAQPEKQSLSSIQYIPVVTYANTGYSGIQGLNGGSFKDLQFPGGGLSVVVGKGKWQFESGLIFTTIGSEFSFRDNAVQAAWLNIKSQSSYLDVPVLARFTFMGDRRYRIFARGGAVAGFLVDSKVTTNGMVGFRSLNSSERRDSAFHDTDVRAMLGMGMAYRLTAAVSMTASVDYQEGLTKLNSSELYDGVDVHSRSVGVTLGLGIRI